MEPKPYRPSIRSLQEDFAQRLTLQRMLKQIRQGRPAPEKTITDNSEPWMENPDSVADYWYIASCVNETAKKWGPILTNSSAS